MLLPGSGPAKPGRGILRDATKHQRAFLSRRVTSPLACDGNRHGLSRRVPAATLRLLVCPFRKVEVQL
jgi:hypothetical protein